MWGTVVHWDPPTILLLLIFLQINPDVVAELLQTAEEPAVEVCCLSAAPLYPTAGKTLDKNISAILEGTWREGKEMYVLIGFYFSSE